jgi:hypothetical protein
MRHNVLLWAREGNPEGAAPRAGRPDDASAPAGSNRHSEEPRKQELYLPVKALSIL